MELKENESREEVFSLSFFLSLLCVCVFLFFKTVHTLEKKRKKRKTQRLHPQMQTNPFSWSFFPVALFFFESWLGFFVSSKTTVGGDLLFFSLCDARTQAHAQFAFLCEEREKKNGGKKATKRKQKFHTALSFCGEKDGRGGEKGRAEHEINFVLVQNLNAALFCVWLSVFWFPCVGLSLSQFFLFFFDQKSVGVSECE